MSIQQDSSGIKIFRTDEITDKMWEEIGKGYEICFGVKHSIAEMKSSFSKSIIGYSLHGLKYNDKGQIIGHNYYQPRPYLLNGRKVICALSGGTFVLPEYRNDMFIFHEIVKALDKEATRLGWIALLAIPNENAFKYSVKINKHKHIGDLDYYILPVNAAKVIKKDNHILNFLSRVYASTILSFSKLSSAFYNPKEIIKPLHIDVSERFLNIRYDWGKYNKVEKGDMIGVYRVYDEGGIQTAYIVYFSENNRRSLKSLAFTVDNILANEKVDAIMYVGTMNFPQSLLLKVPKKYQPQQMPLCVRIFDKTDPELIQICSSIDNIDFGLINFDVR